MILIERTNPDEIRPHTFAPTLPNRKDRFGPAARVQTVRSIVPFYNIGEVSVDDAPTLRRQKVAGLFGIPGIALRPGATALSLLDIGPWVEPQEAVDVSPAPTRGEQSPKAEDFDRS